MNIDTYKITAKKFRLNSEMHSLNCKPGFTKNKHAESMRSKLKKAVWYQRYGLKLISSAGLLPENGEFQSDSPTLGDALRWLETAELNGFAGGTSTVPATASFCRERAVFRLEVTAARRYIEARNP